MEYILTSKNYFNNDRPHRSASQIRDYIHSPELYYRRHALHNPDREFKMSSSVLLGRLVDQLLTENKTEMVAPVLKRDDAIEFERQKTLPEHLKCTQSVWDNGHLMTEYVQKQPIWMDGLNNDKMQTILEEELCGLQVCGKPDRIKKDKVTIDVKCTSEFDGKNEYNWGRKCLKFGYHVQGAMYRHLTGINNFVHFVIYPLGDYQVVLKIYKMTEPMLDFGMQQLKEGLEGIKARKFEDAKVTWNEMTDIFFDVNLLNGGLQEEEPEEETDEKCKF